METELWISAVALVCIFGGGMLRVWQGVLQRPVDEPFVPRKFWSTVITTFFESLIAFTGITFADIGIGGTGALVFFIGCLVLGYLGAKEANVIGEKILKAVSTGAKK